MAIEPYNPSGLSNEELDAAYAAYYDSGNMESANIFANEISKRMNSIPAFAASVFGKDNFPQYTARSGSTKSKTTKLIARVLLAGGALLWWNSRKRK